MMAASGLGGCVGHGSWGSLETDLPVRAAWSTISSPLGPSRARNRPEVRFRGGKQKYDRLPSTTGPLRMDETMANLGKHRSLALLTPLAAVIICYLALHDFEAHGGSPGDEESLAVRLIHPERQAEDVLKLFEGSPVKHPAAALAAWKKATHQSGQLGKPVEALIAFFNPEMSQEWRVLHAAEFCVNWEGADGRPRWHAIVPKDDGTVAAGATALRMTDGATERPIAFEGSEISVERLGRPGAILAAQVGGAVILGSTRDQLMRGISRLRPGGPPEKGDSKRAPGSGGQAGPFDRGITERVDSGAISSWTRVGSQPRMARPCPRG